MPDDTLFSNFAGVDLAKMPSIARGEAEVVTAPLVRATPESLNGYGHLVENFATGKVTIVTWPQPGWRPIVDGTGNEGGVVEDTFEMERRGQIQYAVNHAVDRRYVTGWFDDPATASEHAAPKNPRLLYTHEANYHPDGGQIFFPRTGAAFVALLAKPGDDVKPEDFVAFHFDGRHGVHIDPGVWHQPVFPVGERATFDDRQGKVHACVAVDFVSEFKTYVAVPLA